MKAEVRLQTVVLLKLPALCPLLPLFWKVLVQAHEGRVRQRVENTFGLKYPRKKLGEGTRGQTSERLPQ